MFILFYSSAQDPEKICIFLNANLNFNNVLSIFNYPVESHIIMMALNALYVYTFVYLQLYSLYSIN